MNDNFDPACLNATFEKDKAKANARPSPNHHPCPSDATSAPLPHPCQKRAVLVATRAIGRGEELYASYGEGYWRARGIDPATGKPLPPASN